MHAHSQLQETAVTVYWVVQKKQSKLATEKKFCKTVHKMGVAIGLDVLGTLVTSLLQIN